MRAPAERIDVGAEVAALRERMAERDVAEARMLELLARLVDGA